MHVVYLILRHKIDRSVSFLHETDCLLYYSKKRLVFLQRMLIHFAKSALRHNPPLILDRGFTRELFKISVKVAFSGKPYLACKVDHGDAEFFGQQLFGIFDT